MATHSLISNTINLSCYCPLNVFVGIEHVGIAIVFDFDSDIEIQFVGLEHLSIRI